MQTYYKLHKAPNFNPRGYNLQMWQAAQACPGINTGKGVTLQTLAAHLNKAIPHPSPAAVVANIKYMAKQKAALVATNHA